MLFSRFDHTDGNEGVLAINGDLTIENADELRSALIKALLNADRVLLDCGASSKADLAGLQLLCSAHRTALRLKKQFQFKSPCREAVKTAAEKTGYLRTRGCSLDTQGNCLWLEDRT